MEDAGSAKGEVTANPLDASGLECPGSSPSERCGGNIDDDDPPPPSVECASTRCGDGGIIMPAGELELDEEEEE